VGLLGSPLPLSLAISDGSCGFLSSTTVPLLSCANRVHPLVRFTPLQSTTVAGLPRTQKPEAPSLGFAVPLRDIRHPRLTPRAILACSVPFRPRRFSRPRRFPPRLALWVYFTPLPRPGFSLQGFDSSSAVVALSHNFALLSFVPALLMAVAHHHHIASPRLQGFAPRPNPQPNQWGLATNRVRSPLELVLLQVFSSPTLPMFSHRIPLVTSSERLS